MTSIMPRRCELGCPYTFGVTRHQFPHPERNPDCFKAWVLLIGGKLESPQDYEHYKKRVICDRHFKAEDRNRNNRLNYMAVPSLHLSGVDVPNKASTVPAELPATSDTLVMPKEHTLSSINEPQVKERYGDFKNIAAEHNYFRTQQKNDCNVKYKAVRRNLTPSYISSQLRTYRTQIKALQTEIIRMRKRCKSFKARLANAEIIGRNNYFKLLTQDMTEAAKIFTKIQYTQTLKKRGGRRFTLKEKILSLSIYKRSPKSYTLLSKYFTLPSAKCLKRLLSELKVEEGLNKMLLFKIKETVKNLSPEDCLVSLIFDEMAIMPHIKYDITKDKLRGFASNNNSFADHALVFMIRGIKKKFKQPLAYYFTNCLNKYELVDILKKTVQYIQGTGLKILCVVCDQSTTNVGAINLLIKSTKEKYIKDNKQWRHDIIEIGKSKIVPLYDVPHLIKGIRNNLLTKDLKYFDEDMKTEKTVKWDYYKRVYEADKTYGELKLLQKLTDEHIYPEKIRKMKVKTATQVFNHSVAVVTEHLTARGDLPEECRSIIKFTKTIDNLFDSLNSSTFHIPNGKIYKGCIKRKSPHHQLWNDAIKMLKSIKFIKINKTNNNKVRLVETSRIPSIQNFIKTIEGIKNLWTILSQKYSFDCMFTRNFNQDPIENFFGNIRSFGVRNTAPDTVAFEGAYKSLLLNNFNIPHSSNANCEADENDFLQKIDFFTQSNAASYVTENFQEKITDNDEIIVPYINLTDETDDAGQGNYVCGWVLTKSLKKVSKTCKNCRADVFGDPEDQSNEYLRAKEYNENRNLCYPSKNVRKCFIQIQNLIKEILKKDVPKTNLKKKIRIFTDIFVEYPFKCENHKEEFKHCFEITLINLLINSWSRSINRILSGKATYDGDDEMKTAAQLYRNKHNGKFYK